MPMVEMIGHFFQMASISLFLAWDLYGSIFINCILELNMSIYNYLNSYMIIFRANKFLVEHSTWSFTINIDFLIQ